MYQSAVFVDAGYFYAQGSQLLAGERQSREKCALNIEALHAEIATLASAVAPEARFLRTYWYDGLIRGGVPTSEQTALGRANDIKLRLGMVNSRGQQKGVDSLIVIDLVELARNRAVTDAIIIAGDEDIRIGVQLAQNFGVRVHLVGIKPALGSQSPDLVAEADNHIEWDEAIVSKILHLNETKHPTTEAEGKGVDRSFDTMVDDLIASELAKLDVSQRKQTADYISANKGALPSELDRPTLAALRDLLGRDLSTDERKKFRQSFRQAIRTEIAA